MMLNRATSDKPEPTPGYLFADITKLTFESAQMSADLMEYLLARLKKKSVHTKIKTLKILKYLVEKGHEGFYKDLQRRSDELRQAMGVLGRAVDARKELERQRESVCVRVRACVAKQIGGQACLRPRSLIFILGLFWHYAEFKGTVDPLHGDTFNKQVREHAAVRTREKERGNTGRSKGA